MIFLDVTKNGDPFYVNIEKVTSITVCEGTVFLWFNSERIETDFTSVQEFCDFLAMHGVPIQLHV